jgi:hypothetical protein
MATVEGGPPAPSGQLLTRKLGPMPMWAWMLAGLAVALVYRQWQANKAATTQTTGSTVDTTPPNVTQDFITINAPISTAPEEPPGQGRSEPPQGGGQGGVAGGTPPAVVHPGPIPVRVPSRPTPTPAPTKPAGQWVTVAKWTATRTAWNSTLSGIAAHFKIKSWQTVWNAPQNAALKARRKDPKLIQPGDKIFVPA